MFQISEDEARKVSLFQYIGTPQKIVLDVVEEEGKNFPRVKLVYPVIYLAGSLIVTRDIPGQDLYMDLFINEREKSSQIFIAFTRRPGFDLIKEIFPPAEMCVDRSKGYSVELVMKAEAKMEKEATEQFLDMYDAFRQFRVDFAQTRFEEEIEHSIWGSGLYYYIDDIEIMRPRQRQH